VGPGRYQGGDRKRNARPRRLGQGSWPGYPPERVMRSGGRDGTLGR